MPRSNTCVAEQYHQAVKRVVRSMLAFRSARTTLLGLELMHMINNGQMVFDAGENLSAAERFYSLAPSNAPKGTRTALQ